jgi:hypothetical protein
VSDRREDSAHHLVFFFLNLRHLRRKQLLGLHDLILKQHEDLLLTGDLCQCLGLLTDLRREGLFRCRFFNRFSQFLMPFEVLFAPVETDKLLMDLDHLLRAQTQAVSYVEPDPVE